jgi:hypothetical protein
MNVPPAVIVLVVVMVLLAVWAIRTELRRTKEQARLLSAMGFQLVAQPDPRDGEALLGLYRRERGALRGQRLVLRRVFQSDSSDGRLFVFDVLAPDSRRSSHVAAGAVGVVRRGAGLPIFEICAISEQGGMAGRMVIHLVTKELHHGHVVRFDDLPEFAQRFTVLAPDEAGEAAVRSYLTADVRQRLMGLQFFALTAGGDALALQALPPRMGSRVSETVALRKLIEDALLAAAAMAPGPTRAV